jgi:hypothetical protein
MTAIPAPRAIAAMNVHAVAEIPPLTGISRETPRLVRTDNIRALVSDPVSEEERVAFCAALLADTAFTVTRRETP